ncbi:MAG: NAD-dependent DNA ligase LigA [Candidatus Brocadiia bacterium]|jgi:DNA ligase (NAD+)
MGKEKSTASNVEQQIEKLRETIRYHDQKYFVEDAPEISDHEYDLLMEQLEDLEAHHPDLITPDSPTQRVGGEPLAAFKSVRHAVPMRSIAKALSADKLLPFDKRVHQDLAKKGNHDKLQYVVEPKVDGVALSLRYERGSLTLAATRGDGEKGDDVTQNVRTVRAIPAALHINEPPDVLEIRGEAYMSYKSLQKCNKERKEAGAPLFANPRNATAGSLKLLDSRITARRGLLFFAYAIGETKGVTFDTQWEILTTLMKFGLPVNPHRKLCGSIEEVITLTKEWDKLRTTLAYAWDGMVIKVNSLKQQELLGETSKAPVGMIAFKFEPEKVTTRLLEVDWQVGRTGILTPVARLSPVRLAGTKVANATLHNINEIRRKGVHLGDDVLIEKAGEIIPQVVKVAVHHKGKDILPPKTCSVCREKILVEERKEEAYEKLQYRCTNNSCIRAKDWKTLPRSKGVAKERTLCPVNTCKSPVELRKVCVPERVSTSYRCVFPLCPAMLTARLVFFASRGAMNIEGLGPELINLLVEKGVVKDFADLYSLDRTTLDSLIRKPDAKRELWRTLRNLLRRNAIEVEEQAARKLTERFRNFDAIEGASVEALLKTGAVDAALAEMIHRFFANPASAEIIAKYRSEEEGLSAVSIIKAIGASKERDLWRLINGLGIKHVGATNARKLAEHFLDMGKLARASAEELRKVNDIGTVVAQSVYDFFRNPRSEALIAKLREAGLKMKEDRAEPILEGPFVGKTVVVTGSLKKFTRPEAQEALRRAGASISESVGRKTDYLVVGENPGSKLEKARALAVKAISEAEMLTMLGHNDTSKPEKHVTRAKAGRLF